MSELFRNWPLWHYATLRGLSKSLNINVYYDVDNDTFVRQQDIAAMGKVRSSEVYLIVGASATINMIYTSLSKKQVPPIPPNILAIINQHISQDPILSRLLGPQQSQSASAPAPQPPAPAPVPAPAKPAPQQPYKPTINFDIKKISTTLNTIAPNQCVNIVTASKVTSSPMYLEYPGAPGLCYPKNRQDIQPADVQPAMIYVMNEVKRYRDAQAQILRENMHTTENVVSNEANKLERINALSRRSINVPPPTTTTTTTTTTQQNLPRRPPNITTLEVDQLANNLADIKLRVEAHQQTNTPVTANIIDSINASENRIQARSLANNRAPTASPPRPRAKSPTPQNVRADILQDRLNAMIEGDITEQEDEEANLFTQFRRTSPPRGRQSSSPRRRSPSPGCDSYPEMEEELDI